MERLYLLSAPVLLSFGAVAFQVGLDLLKILDEELTNLCEVFGLGEHRVEDTNVLEWEGSVKKHTEDRCKVDLLQSLVHIFKHARVPIFDASEWERCLLVGEEDRPHLVLRAATVIARLSHAVVTEDYQCSLVIHQFNHLSDLGLGVHELSLDFRMRCIEAVSCTINTDYVAKQEVELASLFQLVKDVGVRSRI